jgi:C4-dicarboxylate transporter, DctQ subunit
VAGFSAALSCLLNRRAEMPGVFFGAFGCLKQAEWGLMFKILDWLSERAKDLASIFLGLMFLTFIAQIIFRYVLNLPLDWTLELCLTLWLWVVFWGTAFVMEDQDHVRFDIYYHSHGEKGRRVLTFIYSACIVAAFVVSLPATISYVTFYKIKKSMTMGIRLDYVFSVYVIFAVAMILQYSLSCWRVATGQPFEAQSFYAIQITPADTALANETKAS